MLAVLLASPGLLGAETFPASPPVEMLANGKAAKLLIHVVKPDYPAVAKVNLIQGSVKLHITVNPEGRVAAAHVVEGEPLLAAAALQAVRKWLYRPYRTAKGAAAFTTIVAVKFFLHRHRFNRFRRLPKDPDGFLERQIHPPEVITQPRPDPTSASVRFRVLVGSRGEVLDAAPMGASGAEAEAARENLRHWKFRPARWGALAVPWYIIVKVPYESTLEARKGYSARH